MAMECRNMKHSLSILWSIENIQSWESTLTISSQKFTPRGFDEKSFRLFLFRSVSRGTQRCVERYLILSLRCQEDEAFDIPIDCEVSLIGLDGSEFTSNLVENEVFQENRLNIVISSVTVNDVFVSRRSKLLPHDTLTLRIRIRKSLGDFSENELFSIGSRIQSLTNALLWSIPGFSTLALNQEVTIPVRNEFFGSPYEFALEFSFKGETLEQASGHVELSAVSDVDDLPIAVLNVSIMMTEDNLVENFKAKWGWQGVEIGRRNELLCYEYCDVPNDVLRLLCVMSFYHITSVIEKSLYGCSSKIFDAYLNGRSSQPHVDPALRGSESREDIESLYRDEDETDFELYVGKVSLPVHKVVLSARSAFFRNLFSRNMSESNFMEIRNLDMPTLSLMITFLYKGSVDNLEGENAVNLYDAAYLYQVPSLLRECRSYFMSTISVRNVSDILQLADKYKDDELKSLVYFAVSRHFPEIINSPEWAEFMEREPELAVKSMHQSYLINIKDKRKGDQGL